MTDDQIEGNWRQLSGSFREKFGRFTKNDIAELTGRSEQLIGKLQEKYGDTREEAERRYHEWTTGLDHVLNTRKASAAGSKH